MGYRSWMPTIFANIWTEYLQWVTERPLEVCLILTT
jgi:hypothetical protein